MNTISEIVRASNCFWADTIYSYYESCKDYDLCLVPEFPHYDALNSASLVTRKGLDDIQVPIWTNPESEIVPLLQERGYRIIEEEIWQYFDLQTLIPAKNTFLKCDESELGFSDDLKTFCDISTKMNSAPDLSEHVYAKLQKSEAEVLLLTYKGEAAATMCLGHVGDMSFLSLGATLPQFRRLGLMRYLCLESAERARARGSRFLYSNTEKPNEASLKASTGVGSKAIFTQSLWKLDDK